MYVYLLYITFVDFATLSLQYNILIDDYCYFYIKVIRKNLINLKIT
jgi:hypothetical protein